MTLSREAFENQLYTTWASHMGLPTETLPAGGYHIVTLDDLDATSTVQLFKLGRFAYLRCDPQLADLLTQTMQQIAAADTYPREITGGDLQHHLTDKQFEYDHIERVFYLYPDDFAPVANPSAALRVLSKNDEAALETLKSHCTAEEIDDSYVSVTDELAIGAFDGDVLVACASMYMLWGFADPGVLVHPDYRSKGIGKAVVAEICAHVLEQGDIMMYRCTTDNVGSGRLAESLGFTQHFEIEVFKILML